MFSNKNNATRLRATALIAALLASGGSVAAPTLSQIEDQANARASASAEAMSQLQAIQDELQDIPLSDEGLATLESLKQRLRKAPTPSDEASLKWGKLRRELQARESEMRAAVQKQHCEKVMAGMALPHDQIRQQVAVQFEELTLGDFICVAKTSGSFIEYSGPSFFNSTYTLKTNSFVLVFKEHEVSTAGDTILVLDAIESPQERIRLSDTREAVFVASEAYANLKNSGNQ